MPCPVSFWVRCCSVGPATRPGPCPGMHRPPDVVDQFFALHSTRRAARCPDGRGGGAPGDRSVAAHRAPLVMSRCPAPSDAVARRGQPNTVSAGEVAAQRGLTEGADTAIVVTDR